MIDIFNFKDYNITVTIDSIDITVIADNKKWAIQAHEVFSGEGYSFNLIEDNTDVMNHVFYHFASPTLFFDQFEWKKVFVSAQSLQDMDTNNEMYKWSQGLIKLLRQLYVYRDGI